LRAAAIGIGSNSLRLLVADLENNQLRTVLRDREGLRVFASLNERREISQDMIHEACASVGKMKRAAEQLGAETILLFATSAVRDAKNQRALSDALLQATGLALDICSGEMEARLSFLGAVEYARSGMIDIGGGSTEIVIGERDAVEFSCSLQAGAVRLFEETPIRNIPDAYRVKEIVKYLLIPYLQKIEQIKRPAFWVGVGGTMTAAATCVQDIDWNAGEGVHGFTAEQTEVCRVLETLAEMTADRRRNLRSVPPDRADIIVHGFAILLGCMEALKIERIAISERTNLDGYLKLFTADG
jgi:exopolyphosphatase/guanosine-5'-triphosphate,3'-diphosphate pyrophosphatase